MADSKLDTAALAALLFEVILQQRELRAEVDALRAGQPRHRRVPPCCWLPAKRAAHLAGVTPQAATGWAANGLVTALMCDGAWYFQPSSLQTQILIRSAKVLSTKRAPQAV